MFQLPLFNQLFSAEDSCCNSCAHAFIPHAKAPSTLQVNTCITKRSKSYHKPHSSLHTVLHASLLAALLTCFAAPLSAFAEVRTSDSVLGKPAEELSIDVTELPDFAAPHAIVMDKDGTIFYERDADAEVRIASITKVMTAILTLENTDGSETMTIDHRAATVGESSAGLKEGDRLTVDSCLKALMIPSGNDAAMALATYVGHKIDPNTQDPYSTFIEAMNTKAAELGMKHSLFENPHGLDFNGWEGNLHSSAHDVALMFKYAMQNEKFRTLTSNPNNKITVVGTDGSERTLEMIERNLILGEHGNIGGKTGGTYEALQCFVGAFSRDDREVYTVTLGSDGEDQRWADTLAVANWYYDHWTALPLVHTTSKLGETPILGKAVCSSWTDKVVRVSIDDPQAVTAPVFTLAGPVEQKLDLRELSSEVSKGDKAGTLCFTQNGTEIGKADLIAAEDIAEPSPFEWVMIQFDRVVRFFESKPSTAESSALNKAPNPLEYDAWEAVIA